MDQIRFSNRREIVDKYLGTGIQVSDDTVLELLQRLAGQEIERLRIDIQSLMTADQSKCLDWLVFTNQSIASLQVTKRRRISTTSVQTRCIRT